MKSRHSRGGLSTAGEASACRQCTRRQTQAGSQALPESRHQKREISAFIGKKSENEERLGVQKKKGSKIALFSHPIKTNTSAHASSRVVEEKELRKQMSTKLLLRALFKLFPVFFVCLLTKECTNLCVIAAHVTEGHVFFLFFFFLVASKPLNR